MLTKLRCAAGEGNIQSSSGGSSDTSSGKTDPSHGLQIVGMTATLPSVAAVADWLRSLFVGELELPFVSLLLVILAPYQLMNLRYIRSRSLLLVDFMPVKNATNFCFCTTENAEENF
ncbi:uncharacterized protein LOC114291264 [Camellia sinensis]|uniref:uncharacterized protein LOC114291264 n=1 Tax=Camellia sinensis TaxID=4442 RepID=UPI001035ED64|nr:uncharacterized protein LOC114291264 [Camellia sinensis]